MKKLLLPLLLGQLLVVSGAQAEDLLEIYQLALQNDAQLRAAMANRDSAWRHSRRPRPNCCPASVSPAMPTWSAPT